VCVCVFLLIDKLDTHPVGFEGTKELLSIGFSSLAYCMKAISRVKSIKANLMMITFWGKT
jgi:hypothetical protein